jgi:hypothetical protein
MSPTTISQSLVTDFLDTLPGYDHNQGVSEMLELLRTIQESELYYWVGAAFPFGAAITVPALATVNGTISLPAGTIITAFTYYTNTVAVQVTLPGFKISLRDKGSKASIFYGDYILDRLVASNMQIQYGVGATNPPTCPGMNADDPFGPNYLLNPFIVTAPGILAWEIVNLNPIASTFQAMLSCAVPVLDMTVGQVIVKRS